MKVKCALVDDLSQLIAKAKKGEKDAFGQIYTLFYRRIFRYCKFNLAGHGHDAQDICQETFLRAYKSLHSFNERKGGSFQAYLFRIARNLIIDASRKKKDVPLKDYWEIEKDEDLEADLDREIEAQKIRKALSQLVDVDRNIIVLRHFEEMTTAEVARTVNMREGALRVRLHRIHKKLKELVEKND